MKPQAFDFAGPVVPISQAWEQAIDVPISGRDPAARHASATGAAHVAVVRGKLIRSILAAFLKDGKLTIRELAAEVCRDPNSITSTWSKLEDLGWIEGLKTFRSYVHKESGRTILGEQHALTTRGREVAIANLRETVRAIEDRA